MLPRSPAFPGHGHPLVQLDPLRVPPFLPTLTPYYIHVIAVCSYSNLINLTLPILLIPIFMNHISIVFLFFLRRRNQLVYMVGILQWETFTRSRDLVPEIG